MANEKHKDVAVGGRVFRIGVFPPAIGSMVLMQSLSGRLLKDEEIFTSVRANVLDVVQLLDKQADGSLMPLKLYDKGKDRWLVPEPVNPGDALKLITEALDFNLAPFFPGRAQQSDSAGDATSSPSDSQTS